MAFTALYDASVLQPPAMRDVLVRLGQTGLFRACWTEEILDRVIDAVLCSRPDLQSDELARSRELMCSVVPDCLVAGYESLVEGLEVPDTDDRHIVAAAIRCSAQVIVTANLSGFPASALDPFNIEAQSPDQFVLDLVDLAPARVAAVVQQQSAATSGSRTVDELLDELSTVGLPRSVAALRDSLDG